LQNLEECDATEDAQRFEVGNKKIFQKASFLFLPLSGKLKNPETQSIPSIRDF
jgi:hypothetical protein